MLHHADQRRGDALERRAHGVAKAVARGELEQLEAPSHPLRNGHVARSEAPFALAPSLPVAVAAVNACPVLDTRVGARWREARRERRRQPMQRCRRWRGWRGWRGWWSARDWLATR